MRKTKTITIAGKEVTFTEIPVNKVIAMLRGDSPLYAMPVGAALGELAGLIPYAIDCPLDDLLDLEMYSDEMKQIEEAFKEVNPGFFDIAHRLDLVGALGGIVKAVIGCYCSNMLILPNMATPTLESTDSGSLKI